MRAAGNSVIALFGCNGYTEIASHMNNGTRSMGHAARRSGLGASLLMLGAIVVVAIIGLGFAGNWPKVLRVALASSTYAAVLLAFARRRPEPVLGAFVAAGAAAGLVSGIVRTTTSPGVVVAGALGAALLLGPLHWWALRTWRRQDG